MQHLIFEASPKVKHVHFSMKLTLKNDKVKDIRMLTAQKFKYLEVTIKVVKKEVKCGEL